jgi:tRNA pseudouridine38-40 synthase
MRYFLLLEYKGTHYKGWQRQPGALSVQQVVEEAFERLLRRKVFIIGCGRTDSGVHASGYVAHVDTNEPFGDDFAVNINRILPDDIALRDYQLVEKGLHAQFSAVARRYDYYFHLQKLPFLSETSTYVYESFHCLDGMKMAVDSICKYNNFNAFCLTPLRHENTLCAVKWADFKWNDDATRFCFSIKANRFLRGMVRILAGKLIEVGAGRMTIEQFEFHLREGEPFKHKNQAFPQGLYLSQVDYPNTIFADNSLLKIVEPAF